MRMECGIDLVGWLVLWVSYVQLNSEGHMETGPSLKV